jgi:hypothetical protein
MSRDTLDVFLSSDQEEFEKERNKLSGIISSIPFLACIPLENSGAVARDTLEASLRAARHSDIYVGVFGREYSATAIKEYREAVRYRKPCLTYVKKVKQRDTRLQEFIDGELKNQFKYCPFRGRKDLYEQVEKDLRGFLFETLQDGLEARKHTKEEVQRLFKEERQAAPARTATEEPLAGADSAFSQGNYLECLVRTAIALELALKGALRARNISAEGKSLGVLLQLATKSEVIDRQEANQLQEVSYIRNSAVHRGDIPSKQTIVWVLENTRRILNRLQHAQRS